MDLDLNRNLTAAEQALKDEGNALLAPGTSFEDRAAFLKKVYGLSREGGDVHTDFLIIVVLAFIFVIP